MRRTGDILLGLGVTLLWHEEIRKSVGRTANSFLIPCIREIIHRRRHVRTAADCSGAAPFLQSQQYLTIPSTVISL